MGNESVSQLNERGYPIMPFLVTLKAGSGSASTCACGQTGCVVMVESDVMCRETIGWDE